MHRRVPALAPALVIALAIALACGCGDADDPGRDHRATTAAPSARAPAGDDDAALPATARPVPPSGDLPAMALRSVELIELMGDTAARHAGDCPAMARAFEAIIEESRDFYAQLRELQADDERAAALDQIVDGYRTRTEAGMKKLQESMTPCLENEHMLEIMASMPI